MFALLIACMPPKIGLDDIQSVEDIERLCAESTPEEETVLVRFEAETEDCPWEEDDNLPAQDGYYTARIESTEDLDIPTSAVLCDVEYNFQVNPDEAQIMRYDDHFVLDFNGAVLAASNRQVAEFMPTSDDLRIWDWSEVAGQQIDWNQTDNWCLGEDEGLADCTIPATDTPGEMLLDYDDAIVDKLSLRAVERGRVEFTFTTIGDNDAGTDCTHEPFEFEIDVAYVEAR